MIFFFQYIKENVYRQIDTGMSLIYVGGPTKGSLYDAGSATEVNVKF